ncbi:MAG: sigma-54 dependent transcriptional regulator, partial [Candidatus Theseobacter exili]|nr:sigma-54 dependent transcriptional regulator [Candidatus Theseobacter exili]
MKNINLMIVDNEKLLLQSLVDLLESQGYNVKAFLSAEEAISVLKKGKHSFDIILTDINMPLMDGYLFIEEIRKNILKDIKIIVLTGYGSIDSAVKAVKLGADSYCQKELDPELLLFEIRKLAEQIKLRRDFEALQKGLGKNPLYLFSSKDKETRKVFTTAKQIASKEVNILITGESGTGKEIMSRFIYNNSGVKGRFVSVNCSAIPDSLFESSMFGHVKGAFTGAHENAPGFFKEAEGGVLLLDEIGELTSMNQAKLLKVIEEKIYFPVGSAEKHNADCRIIAATNQDLMSKIDDGSFRLDFYYRLNTVTLNLPPLRSRKSDILELSDIFIKQFSEKYQNAVNKLSPESEATL